LIGVHRRPDCLFSALLNREFIFTNQVVLKKKVG